MRHIPLPQPKSTIGALLSVPEIYTLCISTFRDDKKQRLSDEAVVNRVREAAVAYNQAAATTMLHQFVEFEGSPSPAVSVADMQDIYTQKMAKRGQPGRPIYDQILAGPPHGRCPLCDVGRVTTLDHHLPKSRYPLLVVTPNNLVPACRDCQTEKDSHHPTCAAEQTLHPYFDDFNSAVWLKAKVDERTPPTFQFYAEPPTSWDEVKVARVHHHLKLLKLCQLYATNAANELCGIRKT